MLQSRLVRGLANFLLLALLVVGSWFVVAKRQDIADWWRLQSYEPSADIVKLADDTALTTQARNLFYVSDPKIQDREAFNFNCHTTVEHGRVLGCYTNQTIYLFNVRDDRLKGVLQVTAVHEMLHAAYERLDTQTRDTVNRLVQEEAAKLSGDKHLQDLLAIYQKTEPGEINNELHSILATEYSVLDTKLEKYYARYFGGSRATVVAFQKAYNAEFDASQARIDAYQNELAALKVHIDANSVELKSRSAQMSSDTARLDGLRESDVAAYNREVPDFNARVREYNRLARETQALVSQYNDIVAKIKNEIALQTDLNQNLDSQYTPITQ